MLKPSILLIPLMLVGAVLLMGARSSSLPPSPWSTGAAFLPQTVALDPDTFGPEVNARQLLEKAVEKLTGNRANWLRTKIRQIMTDRESTFVAEGFLQRGPNHCARLEMTVTTAGVASRLLIVSDGQSVAEERTIGTEPPVIACSDHASDFQGTQAGTATAGTGILETRSCGGPLPLLQHLQSRLSNFKLRTGMLEGQPVIQIKGEWIADGKSDPVLSTIPGRFCYLYLNATTLWLHRLEWWGLDEGERLRPILRVEFRDPIVNQELPLEECQRLFSYHPAQAKADHP